MSLRRGSPGEDRVDMRAGTFSASELLRLPIRLHGIELGRPVDVILDRDRRRALGLEVRCGDAERRFLPLAAARWGGDAIEIPSPLVLLERAELAFYTERGSTLAGLRGSALLRHGEILGNVADLELAADGTIEQFVLETSRGRAAVPYADDLHVGRASRSVRAAS